MPTYSASDLYPSESAARAAALASRACMMVMSDTMSTGRPMVRHCTDTATHLVTYRHVVDSEYGRTLMECAEHAILERARYDADTAELA